MASADVRTRVFLAVCLAVLTAIFPHKLAAQPAYVTTDIVVRPVITRVILHEIGTKRYSFWRLNRPPRYVLDVSDLNRHVDVSHLALAETPIRSIRQDLKKNGTLRIVFDLKDVDLAASARRQDGDVLVDFIPARQVAFVAKSGRRPPSSPPSASKKEAAPLKEAAPAKLAMTPAEQKALYEAIENFRFGDYEEAVAVLEQLRSRYPNNRDVLSTLAMALEESGKYEAALSVFAEWRMLFPADRDAWLGSGRVLMKAGKHLEGAALLKEWIGGHDADIEARLMRVNALVRGGAPDEAAAEAEAVLRHAEAAAEDRAAAHYYLAYIASARGDIATVREHAQASLKDSPEGSYAGLAKRLLQGQAASLGWSGSVSLQGFYSNNVSLLPETLRQNPLLRADPTQPAADGGVLADVVLSYRWPSWMFTYAFNGQFYNRRTDLNLMPQVVSLAWLHGNLTVAPRYEWVQFGKDFLYKGGGVDLMWMPPGWLIRYGLDLKSFNKSYLGTTDLSRLGGVAHDGGVSYTWDWKVQRLALGLTGHVELTKGDATHRGSDSYRQIGATATWWRDFSFVQAQLGLQVYRRNYRSPDTTILAAGYATVKRQDTYLQASLDFTFHPFPSERHERHALVVRAGWQRNRSNYRQPAVAAADGKAFTEWRLSGGWQWLF